MVVARRSWVRVRRLRVQALASALKASNIIVGERGRGGEGGDGAACRAGFTHLPTSQRLASMAETSPSSLTKYWAHTSMLRRIAKNVRKHFKKVGRNWSALQRTLRRVTNETQGPCT